MNTQRQGDGRGGIGLRPLLLALGLALMWLVEFQAGEVATDAPVWGVAAMLAGRFLVDFVGAWACISAVRLILALGRLGLAYWRARSALGAR
jgi:hypothetical protein